MIWYCLGRSGCLLLNRILVMDATQKVVFNTVILYLKILVTMAVSLVSVPLVLKTLGTSDYGLYNLVAGIITMLAFLNNSMLVSSQRYMSVAMGEGKVDRINSIYNTSFILHLSLAILIVLGLELLGVPSIEKLNIDSNRVTVAQIIFQFLIISTFSRILSVPFDAIMNAHEDMLPFSIIEFIDSILMLIVAFTLRFVLIDKLVFYGGCVASIALLSLIMKYGWCFYAYKNYRLVLSKYVTKSQIKEMLSFTGWNLFGSAALMGRNQGVAVLFNLFLGTISNAAYGISNQINNALVHFSSTFQRAINPQIMKSEGMGDRSRLHRIANISSKFSVLAITFISVPLIVLMDDVLYIWLGNKIPSFTSELSKCILIMSILYQFSTGLMSAIQATGNIRNYQILMGSIILLNVPLAYGILKLGFPIYYVTIGFVMFEFLSLIIRMIMAKSIVGITIESYIKDVIIPCLSVVSFSTLLCMIPFFFIESCVLRLISTGVVYIIMFIFLSYLWAFNKNQKAMFKSWIQNVMAKFTF